MQRAYYIENAFWHSKGTEELKHSLVNSAMRQGLELVPRTNADFLTAESLQGEIRAALFWDKDVRLAARMEAAGFVVMNSAGAIARCDDKTLTYLALQPLGVQMPKTILCPTTFPNIGYTSTAFVELAAQELGLPLVIKEGQGSFGQQVYLVQSVEEAERVIRTSAGAPLLFQQFIDASRGVDHRLYVVGDRVVAAMGRRNEHDFRANIAAGGHSEVLTPSQEECELAMRACKALGLDFGGVDLLPSPEGPLLCEVNSNAHFLALKELTGVDPGDAIINRLKEKLQ